MKKNIYDIFICYSRNSGLDTAKKINNLLVREGYSVAYISNTASNEICKKQRIELIEQCSDFILIVDKNAFNKALDPGAKIEEDLQRQELAYALKLKKNIIPLLLSGADIPHKLPEDINSVRFYPQLKRNFDPLDSFFYRLKGYMYSLPRNSFNSLSYSLYGDGGKRTTNNTNEYQVFLSYSRKDYLDENNKPIQGNEISKIMEALSNANIKCWIDRDGIFGGDTYTEKLSSVIKSVPVFLFISTTNSNASKYASREIAIADEYGKKIIPVKLDTSSYNESTRFHLTDVSHIDYWKNPETEIGNLISAIEKALKDINDKEKREKEAQEQRLANLEQQRKLQEQERIVQEKISQIKAQIEAEDNRKAQQEKVFSTKTYELEIARLDLEKTEKRIKQLREDLMETKRSYVNNEMETETFTVDNVVLNMRYVKGGSFAMGNDKGCEDERPIHSVSINGFLIGETVVTQELWEKVTGTTIQQQRDLANPSWPMKGEGRDYPMYYVSWEECQSFIRKINEILKHKLFGRKFRLPTEAEWEYAARGVMTDKEYGGDNRIGDVAWYRKNSRGQVHPVKIKQANEFGLYGMCGNVWEWCQDWYGIYPNDKLDNPQGPSNGIYRVCRGGSWRSNDSNCRVSYRNYNMPNFRNVNLGFRLVI